MDVLTPLSIIFQLHRGGKFDGWNPSTCRQPLNCCIENTMPRVGIILSIFVDCGYNLSQVYWWRNQSTQEKTNQQASSNWKLYNIVVLIRPHDRQISNSQHLQWWAQMPIQLHDLYSNNPDVGSWPMPISSVKFSKMVGQCVLFVWAFLLQKSWYSWIYSCAIYTCIKSHNSQKGNSSNCIPVQSVDSSDRLYVVLTFHCKIVIYVFKCIMSYDLTHMYAQVKTFSQLIQINAFQIEKYWKQDLKLIGSVTSCNFNLYAWRNHVVLLRYIFYKWLFWISCPNFPDRISDYFL
jgi:hypothetical protein